MELAGIFAAKNPSRRQAITHFSSLLTCLVGSRSRADIITRTRQRLRNWVVFYGAECDPEILSRYDLVVLDPAFKRSIEHVTSRGASSVAYLSLSEIRKANALYPMIHDTSLLLSENASWTGTFLVDVRRPEWRSLLIEYAIPQVLSRGYTGLFLDTADTPGYLESTDPVRFKGARLAAIELIRSIRISFPNALIVVNRGYDLLPNLLSEIDAVVAESLLSSHNYDQGDYRQLSQTEVDDHLKLLRPARERKPPLPVLSLDYWREDDPAVIRDIYKRERALGNIPYVGTTLLDRIVSEPAG